MMPRLTLRKFKPFALTLPINDYFYIFFLNTLVLISDKSLIANQPPLMNHVKFLILLLSLVISSCNSGNKDQNANKKNQPVPVDILIAGNQEFPSSIEVNGSVLSDEMVELHPEVSGRITYLNIPDGAWVKAGTILAKINDADLQAQLQQQKVQLDLAQKTEQRMKKLLAVNGIDQATYDAALSQMNLVDANIKVLNAQIDKTVVKAPFAGRLGLRQVSEGAYVGPSTILGTLQQTDKIKIDFTVPEAYQNLIGIGKTVSIRTASSEESLLATITAIEPQISTATRNIKVRAKLESGTLMPGAFVKVMLDNRVSGIVVPTNVIIPDAFSNQVVIIKKGKVVFKNVETGIRTANIVEISKGLEIGDSVVVSGVLFVRPNSKIKIKAVKTIDKLK
jgi:membrane fusion protein (multidrug efflux system)